MIHPDVLDALVAAGCTPEQIAAAHRADAVVTQTERDKRDADRRLKASERQRRKRERDGHALSRDVTPVTRDTLPPPQMVPPSPTPPTPPFNPPTNPISRQPKAAQPDLASAAETIWALQPKVDGKRKATRPDVLAALKAAVVARGGNLGQIITACRAFYALPASRKDGGKFASGAAVLLNADRWRDFLPDAPDPSPTALDAPPTPAVIAWRAQHFDDTGQWRPEWGPRPALSTPHPPHRRAAA